MKLGPIDLTLSGTPEFSAGVINITVALGFCIYANPGISTHRFSIGGRLIFWHWKLYFWRIPDVGPAVPPGHSDGALKRPD